jgi:hypothetical protein
MTALKAMLIAEAHLQAPWIGIGFCLGLLFGVGIVWIGHIY